MQILELDIDQIKPYEHNPRIISEEAIEKVSQSLKQFGWQQPIVIDKNNVIIVGHTRYYASKKLNYDKVPVKIFTDDDQNKIKAYRLLDNKVGEITEWENVILQKELDEINIDANLDELMSLFENENFETPQLENDFESVPDTTDEYQIPNNDYANFTLVMNKDDKKFCIDFLKNVMNEQNLLTTSQALVFTLKGRR